MKREISPVYLALALIAGCVILRMLNSAYPNVMPNLSPLMALAVVGAMYFPRRWGWLIGPAAFLVTDLAFVRVNALTDGAALSWGTLVLLAIFVAAGGIGVLISGRKSLVKTLGGTLGCSLFFYFASNTFSWWHNPDYAKTASAWWQANTVGVPGYLPTWMFLRNALAGDVIFVVLLLLVLDRALLLGNATERTAARAA